MRPAPLLHALPLLLSAPGCSLLGFYDEPATECPEDLACCSAGDPLAHDGCDWTCNDPAAPDFRMTAMRVEPDGPVSPLFRSALEGAVEGGGLVWLLDLDADGAATTYRTGAGVCEDGACAFAGDPSPSTGMATLGRDGRIGVPMSGTFEATIAVRAPDLGEDIELQLHDCSLVGAVEPGANCMGRRVSRSPGDWSTPARLACAISANEATEVDLRQLNLTLCDLLAGCDVLDCCSTPPGDWPNAPDATVQGFPAWSLRADVAAIGVRIVE